LVTSVQPKHFRITCRRLLNYPIRKCPAFSTGVSINTPVSMFGTSVIAASQLEKNSVCQLDQGERYLIRLWGNNGFGHVNPSSKEIVL
jgi:hypothetical protein